MLVTPTGTQCPASWRSLARPGGPLYSRLVFPTGTKNPPLVPGVKPGLKEGTFSPGLVLPVGKLGLKGGLQGWRSTPRGRTFSPGWCYQPGLKVPLFFFLFLVSIFGFFFHLMISFDIKIHF